MTGPEKALIPQIEGRDDQITALQPQQGMSAIMWVMAQESTPIHGGIFPDSINLGKSLSAVWFV